MSSKNIIVFLFILATLTMGTRFASKEKIEKTYVDSQIEVEKTHLIFINIDGFSYNTYELANENPLTETTNINELKKQGVFFTNAKTGIPSITSAMQQSIASGAWPIDTGNCYRYYDLEKDEIVQYSRENELETLAESAKRNDIDLLGINSWFFKESASNEDKENLYIENLEDNGFIERFEILKKVLNGEEIEVHENKIKYETPPRFISIYLDDIDGAWHNLNDKTEDDSKINLETRAEVEIDVIKTLKDIDTQIGKVMDILKERGIFDNTTFVITTDHGMVPFGADSQEDAESKDFTYSQMPDLLELISKVSKKHLGRGFKVEMVNNEGDKASEDTDAIVTTLGLQVQIKFRQEPSDELLRDIVEAVKGKAYYGDHMYSDQLRVRGVPPRFADLLISPKAPYHFSHDFTRKYYAVNQHDSLDKRVQNIFTMISGPSVKSGLYYNEEVYNIDMTPTMARILGFEGPESATASAIDEVLIDKYKGPRLEILNFSQETKIVREDTIKILVETEANSEIKINRENIGKSNRSGKFETEKKLESGVNRFIIESVKDGKSTRKTIFAIKNKVDKKQ